MGKATERELQPASLINIAPFFNLNNRHCDNLIVDCVDNPQIANSNPIALLITGPLAFKTF